jgi:hypothetical protein
LYWAPFDYIYISHPSLMEWGVPLFLSTCRNWEMLPWAKQATTNKKKRLDQPEFDLPMALLFKVERIQPCCLVGWELWTLALLVRGFFLKKNSFKFAPRKSKPGHEVCYWGFATKALQAISQATAKLDKKLAGRINQSTAWSKLDHLML